MNWEGCGRKQLLPDLRCCPAVYVQGLRKTMNVFSFNIWSVDGDLNLEHHKSEVRMLLIRPQSSVLILPLDCNTRELKL
jgi:hypothetical protein